MSLSSKLEILDKLPLFTYLTPEELEEVARITTEYTFEEGAVLAYQRDVADSFYIVCSGRLYARGVNDQGMVHESEAYTEGDSFKDVWLFDPRPHTATIRATDPGRVLVIRRDDFLDFLDQHPEVLSQLEPAYNEEGKHVGGLTAEGWAEAQKARMAPVETEYRVRDIPAEELIEYATRRSRWLLILKLMPLVVGLLAVLIGYAYVRSTIPGFEGPLLDVVIPMFIVLGFAAIMLLQWLDWRNDYFVITTQHIIHYEFNLSIRNFGTVVKRTPVDQIQSIEIERPNFIANLLNVGTVRVTSAAQSAIIYFDYVDDPHAVHDTLRMLQERVRELDAGREQALMRQSLEEHFLSGAPLQEVEEQRVRAPRQRTFIERLRYNYGSRVVDGDVITYRKHLFVLLDHMAWPMLVGSLLILFAALFLFFEVDIFIFWVLIFVLGLIDIAWLVWQGEDWRNDTYQVTGRYVIDIDRNPFGTGESRKQAELSNVQNINADRPGLLPTIFNYGNVYVETAGASADITFENVANPNQVQRDIFDHRERFRRQQRVREGQQRRKEYAVLLDVYRQAREQDKIPRRTPPTDGLSNGDQPLE